MIDIHFHYPGINPLFNSIDDFPFRKPRKILIKDFTLRAYCRFMGMPFTKDIASINEHCRSKVIEVIEGSKAEKVVVLGMDGVYENGELVPDRSILYVPNDHVYSLDHPKILYGPSINPARKDALEELERAVDRGASLIKAHPAYQFYDTSMHTDFWKEVARRHLPVLIHVGHESALPGLPPSKKHMHPDIVIPLLEQGCTVIMAHAGGIAVKEKKAFSYILHLLEKYPALYMDNSALMQVHRKKRAMSVINSEIAMSRTVFGTDYPIRSYPEAFLRQVGARKVKEVRAIDNPIDKDAQLKHALGFSKETFTRGYDLLEG